MGIKLDLQKVCVAHFDGEVVGVYNSYEDAKEDCQGISVSYDPLYSFLKVRCYSTRRLAKLLRAFA